MSLETRRLSLQTQLEEILGSDHVYFQPPASIHMQYPCIVYNYTGNLVLHANNNPYFERDNYDITLITKDPMPEDTIERLYSISYLRFNRHFVEDNLHHFSYDLRLIERISNV